MSSMAHEFDRSQVMTLASLEQRSGGLQRPEELVAQWDAIHQAASAVAALAQLGPEHPDDALQALPHHAGRLDSSRYQLVARGIDDLSAVMQPGLQALLAMTDRGADTTSAALTLWREFYKARDAIAALAAAR